MNLQQSNYMKQLTFHSRLRNKFVRENKEESRDRYKKQSNISVDLLKKMKREYYLKKLKYKFCQRH